MNVIQNVFEQVCAQIFYTKSHTLKAIPICPYNYVLKAYNNVKVKIRWMTWFVSERLKARAVLVSNSGVAGFCVL